MDKKWFVIGFVSGFITLIIIEFIVAGMFPYTSIEDVCFDQTYTSEEYEECLRMMLENSG